MSQEQYKELIAHREKRRLGLARSHAKRRGGFIVPVHLEPEYSRLRKNKNMTAKQAAEAVGILDRKGNVTNPQWARIK